jgi:hypothetical protein
MEPLQLTMDQRRDLDPVDLQSAELSVEARVGHVRVHDPRVREVDVSQLLVRKIAARRPGHAMPTSPRERFWSLCDHNRAHALIDALMEGI